MSGASDILVIGGGVAGLSAAAALAVPTLSRLAPAADDGPDALIIDCHQHLWDLSRHYPELKPAR